MKERVPGVNVNLPKAGVTEERSYRGSPGAVHSGFRYSPLSPLTTVRLTAQAVECQLLRRLKQKSAVQTQRSVTRFTANLSGSFSVRVNLQLD